MANFSSTYPPIRPVFNADFSNAGRLDSRITFSRSDTPPTYAAPSAVHYWSNEKHLSSENLITYSSDISQSAWTKNGVTETGGQAAPDGGTDAYKLTEDSANSQHRIYYVAAVDSSASLTVSCYVKYIGRQWVSIRLRDSSGTYRHVWFDIQNGTKGTEETSMTGSIAASGNGYYKLTATVSSVYTTSEDVVIAGASADNVTTDYTGLNGDAFAIWGINMSTLGETVLNETSGQIHREYSPTLKSVSTAGQPRFEYSPTDSASMGLLIEGSSTNLVSYSESFSNQTISSSTLTEGAAVGPDGTLNANLLVPTATGTLARNVNLEDGNSFSHTSGNNYAYSIFAKAAGYSYLQWVGLAYFGYTYCNFDLSNGTVGNRSGSVTGSVESVGNGWYRLTVVAPATTTNSSSSKGVWAVVTSSTSGRVEQFTGDGYSGVLLTMAQCELGSFASSYIKSDSGSVSGTTRASDSAAMVNSSLFDNGGGTLYAEASRQAQNTYNGIFSVDDGSGSNIVQMFGNTTNFRAEISSGGTTVANMTAAGNSVNTFHKHAVSFSPSEAKYYVNGSQIGSTDTDLNIPTMSQIHLGELNTSGNHLNGHIRKVAVYSEPVSATNAAALTK